MQIHILSSKAVHRADLLGHTLGHAPDRKVRVGRRAQLAKAYASRSSSETAPGGCSRLAPRTAPLAGSSGQFFVQGPGGIHGCLVFGLRNRPARCGRGVT